MSSHNNPLSTIHVDPARNVEEEQEDAARLNEEDILSEEAFFAECQREFLSEQAAAEERDYTETEGHPYVDVEEQRQVVANEKWREHVKWCDRLAVAQRLSFDNRRVALKILINEAFSRDLTFCRTRPDFTAEMERILRNEWKVVAGRILRDMEVEDNSSVVLRNLSCMCIFIPQDVTRQYGENHESRMRRMENMRDGLRRLQERGALFHGEEGTSMGSSHSSNDGQTSEESEHTPESGL